MSASTEHLITFRVILIVCPALKCFRAKQSVNSVSRKQSHLYCVVTTFLQICLYSGCMLYRGHYCEWMMIDGYKQLKELSKQATGLCTSPKKHPISNWLLDTALNSELSSPFLVFVLASIVIIVMQLARQTTEFIHFNGIVWWADLVNVRCWALANCKWPAISCDSPSSFT